MLKWLVSLFQPQRQVDVEEVDEDLLSVRRRVQELRLALQERERTVERLKADLARQRRGGSTRASAAADVALMRLAEDVAAPASQLLLQEHLLAEGQAVRVVDVMAIARQMVRALEGHGLVFSGEVGAIEAFDPDLHQPLAVGSVSSVPARGQRVRILVPAVAYGSRLLRRAGVEVAED